MQYAALNINAIVLHEVVRKTGGAGSPVLSQAESQLQPDQTAYIQERIRRALGSHARPIVEESGSSPVPDLVKKYLNDGGALLPTSISLVQRLQSVQSGISPAGIFVAAAAELDGDPALLMAKLEHERGVRAAQRELPDGRITFDVQLLRDLLFTTGSKVFKVALFTKSGIQAAVAAADGGTTISGVVVDQQVQGSSVAQFFLTDFLGCRFTERADVLTQRFFEAAESWINTLKDDEKKGRYQVALLGEMQSNKTSLSIDRFASDHFEVEDRDDFAASLKASSVPAREFSKDTELVRGKLARLRIDTKSGVMVLAPPETVSDGTVRIEANEDETSTVTVRDTVTKMSGRGRVAAPKGDDDGS